MDQLPPGVSALLGHGDAYEEIIARLARALLRPGDLALDGGAGRGRDSFALADLVGAAGRVIACEPIPWLSEQLRLDRQRRGLPQVAIHRVALAEQAGTAPFLWVRNADAYSALRPRPYPVTPEIEEIPATLATIDDLLAGEHRPWRYAKLDLQGGELPALRGATRAIARHRPVLVCHNARAVAAATYGYEPEAYFGFFAGLGYRLYDLFGRPFGPADWLPPDRPWYTIAVAADSAEEAAVRGALPAILPAVVHRRADPGLADLDPWLARQAPGEHLETHRRRYLETWRRAGIPLQDAREVVELGGISALGAFLAEERGVQLRPVEGDLRFPCAPLAETADAVLALEVLQHLPDAHTPTSSLAELQIFQHSGAANLFRESFRILRPGGLLVLTTPNVTSIEAIGHLLRRRHAFNYPPHIREYAPADVIALAERAGFVTERAETFRAWYPPPDIDRTALLEGMRSMGFDMAEREDDAFFLFRKPGRAPAPPADAGPPPAPLPPVHLPDGETVEPARLFALQESHNLFEDVIAGLYGTVLQPGDLAVDAGANHGLHTYPMAERVGPRGRLLAIEPIPILADALRAGAVARGLPQIELQQVAVSDAEGMAEFHWIRNADGYSGLQTRDYPFAPDDERLQVRTVRLDRLLEGAEQPWRFIKLDLEGGEFRALQGAERALARARPVIVLENSRETAARTYGYDREEYFRFFAGLGYRLYDLFGRPFTPEGWEDEAHPWYFIGVGAGSADERLVTEALPGILRDVLAGKP
ncbi:FkbM family methyltransferase [Roseicella aerolata]|uniref:FkbM family methyltransferase n=1 Tax=Roseicella aerolata TaxID=2883479 RepID=A0A9X1IB93_9PROT|nr:FkbM family methyltransferase [Roseicella aerolata]MCB4821640.1 FkbM family methyltransferase [Roseicella aerolata]